MPSHGEPGDIAGAMDSGRKAGADAAIGQGGLQISRKINTTDRDLGRLRDNKSFLVSSGRARVIMVLAV
jgi:hypothetical protein